MQEPRVLHTNKPDDAAALADKGILLVGAPSFKPNQVIVDAASPPQNLRLAFHGEGNTVIIGPQTRVKGEFSFAGDGNLAVIGQSPHALQCKLTFRRSNSAAFFGENCSSNAIDCLIEGDGRSLCVGDDCMFSWGIQLRTSDSHGIIDLAERTQINKPENVIIGPHVWIAADVIIMKGVHVGKGSVVGARSLVTKPVPPLSLIAGSPARILRSGVSWTRDSQPSERSIEMLLATLDPHGMSFTA
ncbi:acyltransferase [Microvirga sp. VF16]|uniref:acyltransferase n=1 Tax=Microvirga sp. VF16 TaxID=2807101 RepID=UPI00193E16E5|nr:acyltransferase [Microvirga sp. VF16]QRM35620.1 acyltransferase [Microvirga sp. VF16]